MSHFYDVTLISNEWEKTMHIKMILPALLEARSEGFRPIKYRLFPPLGLATLAAYCSPNDRVTLCDEHVEKVSFDDSPDLIVLEVYTTSAYRAYEIADHYRARGSYVALGGIHVTACPDEAQKHAETIFSGPGEDTWPRFLKDFHQGKPKRHYLSHHRTLENAPFPRRDLFKPNEYLVPNTIVVSRGCPHRCHFCYKENFYQNGKGFYTMTVDRALSEINTLPGRHLFFLDDHLFGHPDFIHSLLAGMQGMNRIWQAAGTVRSILTPALMAKAARSGLRSLFVGFETLSKHNLSEQGKYHNLDQDYDRAIKTLHDLGIMINASFVFGGDDDTKDVFNRTVDWTLENGIETATFHILTPYPGTKLYHSLNKQGRILSQKWDRYDTRHAVFQPSQMTPTELEKGYHHAYQNFYRWSSILKAAQSHNKWSSQFRHILYSGGWKKAEPFWNPVIRWGLLPKFLPILEWILNGIGKKNKQPLPEISNWNPQLPRTDG
jgi:radical SAM superfamily enzyme YgiQ (UPF0313 family)